MTITAALQTIDMAADLMAKQSINATPAASTQIAKT